VPTIAEAMNQLNRIVGLVSEELNECGIPHRDIRLTYDWRNGGSLTLSFETNRAEARDAAKKLLDLGVSPGAACSDDWVYFTEITSIAKGLIWHRVSAVVVTG
jgi:hypothetical protein